MTRPIASTHADAVYLNSGRSPVKKPPALRPGQAMRTIARRHGEDYEAAVRRASALSWWPQVVGGQWPAGTDARCWMWIIKEAP